MKNTASLRHALSLALAASPFLGVAPAHAQPDTQNAPKAENPTNRPPRPNRPEIAPEQRQKERLRRQFQQMGVTDAAAQEALVLYVTDETLARTKLMETARQLQQGLRGDALSDTQIMALLSDYQTAIEEDKTRRTTALAKLKTGFDVTKNPRVEATLTLMGVYGDGPALMMGGFGGGGRPRDDRGANGGNNNNNTAPRPNNPAPPAPGANA
jgi:hypothetical protein